MSSVVATQGPAAPSPALLAVGYLRAMAEQEAPRLVRGYYDASIGKHVLLPAHSWSLEFALTTLPRSAEDVLGERERYLAAVAQAETILADANVARVKQFLTRVDGKWASEERPGSFVITGVVVVDDGSEVVLNNGVIISASEPA